MVTSSGETNHSAAALPSYKIQTVNCERYNVNVICTQSFHESDKILHSIRSQKISKCVAANSMFIALLLVVLMLDKKVLNLHAVSSGRHLFKDHVYSITFLCSVVFCVPHIIHLYNKLDMKQITKQM